MTAPTAVADTTDLTRADWLAARRKGIGGSDMAAIIGLDSYRTPLAVYLDKVGELPDDDRPSEAMEWGNRLEAAVADGALDRIRLDEGPDVSLSMRRSNRILSHPDRPYLLANVDRTVHGHPAGPGVLEVKTTGTWAAKAWEDDDPDHLPTKYVIQQQHYLDVLGWTHGWIAVLIGGNRLRVEHIERDDALIDGLHKVAEEFWQRVVDRRPPPADAASYEVVRDTFKAEPAARAEITDEMRRLLLQRADGKRMEEAGKQAAKAAEARLLQLMEGVEELVLPGHDKPVVTYRQQTRKSYTVAETTFRVLRVSKEMTS